MRAVFRRCRDAPSKNSVLARGPGGQDVRRARAWGAPLFGDFLSGKREKVTRPPAAERSANPEARGRDSLDVGNGVSVQWKLGQPLHGNRSRTRSGAGIFGMGRLGRCRESRFSCKESSFPSGKFSNPSKESPFPSKESSFSSMAIAFPHRESSFPSGKSPFPSRESSFPSGEIPFPSKESSFPSRDSPVRSKESPFPSKESSLASRESTFPLGEFTDSAWEGFPPHRQRLDRHDIPAEVQRQESTRPATTA